MKERFLIDQRSYNPTVEDPDLWVTTPEIVAKIRKDQQACLLLLQMLYCNENLMGLQQDWQTGDIHADTVARVNSYKIGDHWRQVTSGGAVVELAVGWPREVFDIAMTQKSLGPAERRFGDNPMFQYCLPGKGRTIEGLEFSVWPRSGSDANLTARAQFRAITVQAMSVSEDPKDTFGLGDRVVRLEAYASGLWIAAPNQPSQIVGFKKQIGTFGEVDFLKAQFLDWLLTVKREEYENDRWFPYAEVQEEMERWAKGEDGRSRIWMVYNGNGFSYVKPQYRNQGSLGRLNYGKRQYHPDTLFSLEVKKLLKDSHAMKRTIPPLPIT